MEFHASLFYAACSERLSGKAILTGRRRDAEAKSNHEIVGDGEDHDFKSNLGVFLLCASALSCSIVYFQTASDVRNRCARKLRLSFFGRRLSLLLF